MNIFNKLPILGILRGISEGQLENLLEVIVASGLKTVEITMNTKNAKTLIKKMKLAAGKKLTVGAGTVLTLDDMKNALDAGAEFIVTPCLNVEVVRYCHINSIPVFPGALTPTEIYNAWSEGATMVKVFPASLFGPRYFKEIKAPFNKIELMAVGGISKENVVDYFTKGSSAVAFGASIFKKEYLESGKYSIIKEEITQFINAYLEWKTQ